MNRQKVIHISTVLVLFCTLFSSDSFQKISNTSQLYQQFTKYQKTPLANSSPIQKLISPYIIAQKVQQDFFHLINSNQVLSVYGTQISLSVHNKKVIKDLIFLLKKEFILLREDTEELLSKLNIKQIPKVIIQKKPKKNNFSIKSASIHQRAGNHLHKVSTEIKFDYLNGDRLKGDIHLSSNTAKNNLNQNKTDLDIESMFLVWKPKTSIKNIKFGKYKQHLGLGLAQSSNVEGIQIEKLYHDYNIKLAYHDGLFASITTPHILDVPFTFYSVQRKSRQANFTNSTHSGLYFNKHFKSISIYSEVSEYQDHNKLNTFQTANKNSAFSFDVNYKANSKLALGSSITHLGQNFHSRQRLINLHNTKKKYRSPLNDLYYSLDGYFKNKFSSINGISNFKMNLTYKINTKNKILLKYDQIYDHSSDNRNRKNELNLTTVSLEHKTKNNYHFQLSMQHIDFHTNGRSLSGFLQNQNLKDGNLFRTSVKYLF